MKHISDKERLLLDNHIEFDDLCPKRSQKEMRIMSDKILEIVKELDKNYELTKGFKNGSLASLTK